MKKEKLEKKYIKELGNIEINLIADEIEFHLEAEGRATFHSFDNNFNNLSEIKGFFPEIEGTSIRNILDYYLKHKENLISPFSHKEKIEGIKYKLSEEYKREHSNYEVISLSGIYYSINDSPIKLFNENYLGEDPEIYSIFLSYKDLKQLKYPLEINLNSKTIIKNNSKKASKLEEVLN